MPSDAIRKTTDLFISVFVPVNAAYHSSDNSFRRSSTSQNPATPARTNDVTGQKHPKFSLSGTKRSVGAPDSAIMMCHQTNFFFSFNESHINRQLSNVKTKNRCILSLRLMAIALLLCLGKTSERAQCDVMLTAHWLRAG